MIPGKILAFLEDEGTIGVSGTRDANLIPDIHYVSGWSVEPDQRTIRCSIAEGHTTHLLPSLEENRRFSLTVEKIGSHETYQFKGEFVHDAQPSDADLAAHKRVRDRFAKVVSRLLGSRRIYAGLTSLDLVWSSVSLCEKSFFRLPVPALAADSTPRRRNDGHC
jgi:hypothetical protein